MNQATVDKLATDVYAPRHALALEDAKVKEGVERIISEEKARELDELQTSRGIRSRVSALLQELLPVVDPPVASTGKQAELRASLENHHDHQTAHFQAIWQLVDKLVATAALEKGRVS